MKALHVLAVLAAGMIVSHTVFAQTPESAEDFGIFPSRDQYHQFMGQVKQSAAGDPELESMVGLINDVVLQRPIGSTDRQYGTPGSTLGLLSDKNIRDDLEVFDDQYQRLQQLNADIQRRMAEQLCDLDFTDAGRAASRIRELQDDSERELGEVLLPHQLKRLRQIQVQSELRRRSLAELLTTAPLKDDLEINDRQAKELREAEQEIEQELHEEIAKLRQAARQRLISRLSRSQQNRIHELFGEDFQFAEKNSHRDRQKRLP